MALVATRVATEHGSRYLQQLCKHFAHKIPTTFDRLQGTIEFPIGRVDLAADATGLDLRLTPATAEDGGALAGVVERHLVRFAFRETLELVWRDEAGSIVVPPPAPPRPPQEGSTALEGTP